MRCRRLTRFALEPRCVWRAGATAAGTCPRLQLEYSAHLSIIHAVTASYHKNRGKEDMAFNAQVRVHRA